MGMCALYEGCAASASRFDFGGQLAPDAEHWPTSTGQFADGCDPSEPNWAGRPPLSPTRQSRYAPWRTGKANAHVNEEHVVEQPPTVMVIDDDPGVREFTRQAASIGGLSGQPTRFGERISRGGSSRRTHLPGA